MSPHEVVDALIEGNGRFRSGNLRDRDFVGEQEATAGSQNPAAVILSCIDSRVPAEIVMDAGIGWILNVRVAGNVLNHDVLGSLEFGCAVAGAKAIVVMGHTSCGAVQGAFEHVELGHLSSLLAKLGPAVEAATEDGRDEIPLVDRAASWNVTLVLDEIRQQSSLLAGLESEGSIGIYGAMYDLGSGRVRLLG